MTRLLHLLRRLFRGADLTICPRCRGAGTEPAQPTLDPLEDRALLQRAVQMLEDDGAAVHARALRTLLERLDGAP